MVIKNLTDEEIIAKTKKGVYILDFYSDTCTPCKWLDPILESLEGVEVIKINVYDSLLPARFMVRNVPTLVFLKDGHLRHIINGYHPTIKGDINKVLSTLIEVEV